MPRDTRYLRAASARRSPSARLYSAVPRSSECPSIVTIQVGYFFISSALLLSACWPAASMSSWSKAKKTGWNGEFLLRVSMSVDDSVSDVMGSAGTGTGSRTGSGGRGGRPPPVEVTGGGGGIGRLTGGFFLPPHALTASSATIARITTQGLCLIVCLSSLCFGGASDADPASRKPDRGSQQLLFTATSSDIGSCRRG